MRSEADEKPWRPDGGGGSGAVAGVVGIEGGVVSGVINLESSGVRRASGAARAPPMPLSVCMKSSSGGSNADRAAVSRHGRDVVLGAARLRPDQYAQG